MRGVAPTKQCPYRPCRPMKLLLLLILAAVPLASVSRRGEAGLEGARVVVGWGARLRVGGKALRALLLAACGTRVVCSPAPWPERLHRDRALTSHRCTPAGSMTVLPPARPWPGGHLYQCQQSRRLGWHHPDLLQVQRAVACQLPRGPCCTIAWRQQEPVCPHTARPDPDTGRRVAAAG